MEKDSVCGMALEPRTVTVEEATNPELVDNSPLLERAEALRRDGQTVMFMAVSGRAAGLVSVADPVKESAVEAIDLLHREGIRLVMLTGDSRGRTSKAIRSS